MMPKPILLAILLLTIIQSTLAQQPMKTKVAYDTVRVTDYGAKPDSRLNAVVAIQKALEVCRGKKKPLLFFPQGRYDFWPQHAIERVYYESNSTANNPKRNGILIENHANLTIDGNNSMFIYHDRIQPITIDGCSDITVKNLSIDWDVPLMAQGVVVDTTSSYITIRLDDKQHPYELEKGKLVFTGEGWKSALRMVMEYESESHLIAQGTGDDAALGKGWQNYRAEKLANGNIRLFNKFARRPKPGNVLVFRHSARDHAGAFIAESKNVHFERVNLYHCAGLGLLSQYSENLSFKLVNVVPNESKGRYFSGHDDGLHFSSCRGQITVDSCRFEGLMDDPINIHGTYVKIISRLTDHKLLCRFMEPMSIGMQWARPDNKVAFIDNASLQTLGTISVTDFKPITVTDFEITLKDPVPSAIKEGYGLENLSWTPSAVIRNSVFGSCRARGLLVSTPLPILIENNTFRSSGSAILIAGDVNSWYESGAVTDLRITNNRFLAPVLTSNYQFCEAIISIFPEVPQMSGKTPPYHRNISITKNYFECYDYPVLFAQSVSGLTFQDNTLKRDYSFAPFHKRQVGFTLIGCKEVRISGNHIDPNLLGKNISIEYMSPRDLTVKQAELYLRK